MTIHVAKLVHKGPCLTWLELEHYFELPFFKGTASVRVKIFEELVGTSVSTITLRLVHMLAHVVEEVGKVRVLLAHIVYLGQLIVVVVAQSTIVILPRLESVTEASLTTATKASSPYRTLAH